MYVEINGSEFVSYFNAIRPDQFSYDALRALFDWYEQLEEATGEQIELDVIAICCDWTEYDSIEQFNHDRGGDYYETIEDIERETTVIEFDGGFLVEAF
jgi:hypothetical protein